ncbi:hypothetical protein CW306_03155 [Bacillus sp. BA3]|uniref:hypothetical protein n=1 Tax=Bacillus sp. BA3 TaxID=2057910 RepID=UPI000C32455F|nr:hypothetical protein [Bacillus sp. BA3]PKF90517.1 hypothetical protein CW306_03155 [Bacillus sp. BA3]
MNNRYLPSITLANDVLQEIITATELEITELKKQLDKYDRKCNKEAAKVTVEVLFATMRKLTSYVKMQKNLPKRGRQGEIYNFGIPEREVV